MYTSRRSLRTVAAGVIVAGSLLGPAAFSPTSVGAAPLQDAPAPAGPVTLHYLPLTGPTLQRGNTGVEVFLMQITLTYRGYWLSAFPGDFNASTGHAVTAFQKYMGLPRTGKLDSLTRYVLGATMDQARPRTAKAGKSAEVDLGRQVMITQENGALWWVFDISSGSSRTPTPRGEFRMSRQINGLRISDLGRLWRPKYFNGGIAFHGSPSVPTYPASHGCVRLPNESINYIWDVNLVPIGTPVSVY